MADTFGKSWRTLRAHCPLAPPLLARFWTETAYRKFCDRRNWSFLRGEDEFLINTQNTGTVDVTRGSATVSGGSMAYNLSDMDRQFMVGGRGPVYTIISVNDKVDYTLDRPYGGTSATATSASVLDAYLTMPADFRRFIAVLDPANNWQLHLWVTEEELNTWDAQRSSTGTPWAIVSRRLKTQGTTSLIGRIQYELWPYATSNKNYPYYYQKGPSENIMDEDALLGPLSTNVNLLVTLALAEAAEWPGSGDQRNPYFNLSLANAKREMAEREASRLEVVDEEIYSTWLESISWLNRYSFSPIDSRYLQSHDSSIYNGFSGW